MSTFDDRERAYEAKFAHDADLRFKADARRNRLLGEWAAGLLGKEGEDIRSYAMTVVTADFQKAGDEDVFRKIRTDLDAAGVTMSDDESRAKMVDLLNDAAEQINPGQ